MSLTGSEEEIRSTAEDSEARGRSLGADSDMAAAPNGAVIRMTSTAIVSSCKANYMSSSILGFSNSLCNQIKPKCNKELRSSYCSLIIGQKAIQIFLLYDVRNNPKFWLNPYQFTFI